MVQEVSRDRSQIIRPSLLAPNHTKKKQCFRPFIPFKRGVTELWSLLEPLTFGSFVVSWLRSCLNNLPCVQKSPRVRKMFCLQFWGRKWVHQFYGRLEKCILSAGKTHVHKIPRFFGGGVFVYAWNGCHLSNWRFRLETVHILGPKWVYFRPFRTTFSMIVAQIVVFIVISLFPPF